MRVRLTSSRARAAAVLPKSNCKCCALRRVSASEISGRGRRGIVVNDQQFSPGDSRKNAVSIIPADVPLLSAAQRVRLPQ